MILAIIALTILLIITVYFLIKTNNNRNLLKRKYSYIIDTEKELEELSNECADEQNKINSLQQDYIEKYKIYTELKEKIDLYENEINYINCGLYTPQFNFLTSALYQQKLSVNLEEQKQLILKDKAVICDTEWIVQGSKSNGAKMINKEKELMLRTFNAQFDLQTDKMKWNNVGIIEKRILKSFADINKIGEFHNIYISDKYLNLKRQQLWLYYELQQKIYQEKEEERERKLKEKEDEKRRAEEEERVKKIKEDELKAKELEEKIRLAKEEGKQEAATEFEYEREELLKRAEENKRILSRWEQGYRDGYVYIVSNIGSFGENVYKIGMTTRADDLETGRTGAEKRVYELNNASVPFKFFIHAAIWTEDAPELESKLHKRFDSFRINKVNLSKEFFKVPLEEIKKAADEITNRDILFRYAWDLPYLEDKWNQDFIQSQNLSEALPVSVKENHKEEILPPSI